MLLSASHYDFKFNLIEIIPHNELQFLHRRADVYRVWISDTGS